MNPLSRLGDITVSQQRIKRESMICQNSPIAYYLRDAIRHRKNREHLNFGSAIKTGNFITMYVEAYMCGCDMKGAY